MRKKLDNNFDAVAFKPIQLNNALIELLMIGLIFFGF